ncbi:MAG: ABC transporter permease [Clostridiales bacterium]|nr:ABC transporter permease [Clostridiales bacterium]
MSKNMNNKKKKESQIKGIWHRFKKNKSALVAFYLLIFVALVAIFASVIVDPELVTKQVIRERLQSPSLQHLFGTDGYGRDMFARIVHAAKYSLSIGIISACFSLIAGALIGACASLYGGFVDNVLMRAIDVLASIPGTLLALVIVASLGANMINLLVAISISGIPVFARLARSSMLGVIDSDYVVAARIYGTSDMRLMVKHILPNALGPLIVQTTMTVSGNILTAASLSFIGLGIQPPEPEWGSLLNAGKEFMQEHIYLLVIPGVALLVTALAVNLVGDGLRDALDPRLKS